MTATVISFGSRPKTSLPRERKVVRRVVEPKLPLESIDFAGRLLFWSAERLDDRSFDKALRFEGIQTVLDLRDEPKLSGLRSLHHRRCSFLDRWGISYFRLGHLISKAEKSAMFPFDVARLIADRLQEEGLLSSLSMSIMRGAVLTIYPEQSGRLGNFLDACRMLGLSGFEAVPFHK